MLLRRQSCDVSRQHPTVFHIRLHRNGETEAHEYSVGGILAWEVDENENELVHWGKTPWISASAPGVEGRLICSVSDHVDGNPLVVWVGALLNEIGVRSADRQY